MGIKKGGGIMHDQWQKKLKKHLVGRTIVKVEWLSPKRTEKLLGWTNQPCEIYLDNGTILTPSADDEGNAQAHDPRSIKLYEGTQIAMLVEQGLSLSPIREGWDAVRDYLYRL
jgi:hypothetical protein